MYVMIERIEINPPEDEAIIAPTHGGDQPRQMLFIERCFQALFRDNTALSLEKTLTLNKYPFF